MKTTQIAKWTACVALGLTLAACQTQPAETTSQRLANAREHRGLLKIEPITAGTVHVDGDLAEWGSMLTHGAVVCPQLDAAIGRFTGQAAAGGVALKTDGQALYIALRVVDPSVVVRDPAWAGDCVELFLDVRPTNAPDPAKCLAAPAYGDGVYQLLLTPPREPGGKGHWSQGNGSNAPLGQIDYASQLTSDGYTIEARIPLNSLHGVDAQRLQQPIGFGIMIDDIDRIPGRKSTTERLGYGWGANGESWHDPRTLGIAEPGTAENTPTAVVRALGGRLKPTWDGRQIEVGLIVPSGANVPLESTTVALGLEGQTQQTLSTTWQRVAYPSLGVDVLAGVAPVSEIKSGKYVVETTFPGTKVLSHFDGIAWHTTTNAVARQPAGVIVPGPQPDGTTLLHSGWKVTPAGTPIQLSGDMPVRMAWAQDGKHLLVTTAGFQDEGAHLVDVANHKEVHFVDLGRTYVGMCAVGDEWLISGANGQQGSTFAPVHRIKQQAGQLVDAGPMTIKGLTPKNTYISGLATGKDGALFLADIEANEVSKLFAGKVGPRAKVGYRPYGLAVSPDGLQLAVSNWGDESVTLLATANLTPTATIAVGNHPNDLQYATDGRLFVSCAGSNSVSVISNDKVIETIVTSLDPKAPVGSTPVALTISADASRLYVANADNNSVAVVDTSVAGKSRVLGFIPTGWYPTALTLSPDGRKLYVGVGKGLGAMRARSPDYIGRLFEGAISEVTLPDAQGLDQMTRQVAMNTPSSTNEIQNDLYAQQIQHIVFPKIKHVLFIIRENRTYDQVLGDLPKGNGDPNLAMFGQDVTPNAHRLATEYVLLDNLYCNGEVSQDGHEWCNSAYATDFTQKSWIQTYSQRAQPPGDDRLTASPAGYLWTSCAKHGKTYRSYGEYASFTSSPDKAPVFDGDKGLEGHACLKWTQQSRDKDAAKVFIDELHDAEKTGQWPQYMVMSLGEDHTAGLAPGRHTPAAMVASNDQALGLMVDAISHSRFWKETAIFVMEDDAQDGHDHVDAHRTVGLVISPYTRQGTIDSTMYTTVSMVRTMEMILGLPPMTQFDANAPIMYRTFADTVDATPPTYANQPALINMDAMNPTTGADAEASAKLDWSQFDKADPIALNGILWRAWKPTVPEPAPVRRLAATPLPDKDD